MRPLAGRIALVTGASRGIGAAIATELGRLGAHVVITARTQGGLEETDDAIQAAGGTASLLPLDLKAQKDIEAVGPSIHQRFGSLDILVHCAAMLGRLTPTPHITEQDWTNVTAVIPTAAMRLIRSCGPALLASSAGRAVFLTNANPPTAYWGTYGAANAALRHLVECWAAETRASNLRINLADPGPTGTRLRSDAMPGEARSSIQQPQEAATRIVPLCLAEETRHGAVVRLAEAAAA